MTADQFAGIVRAIAAAGFGFLAGKGFLDAETATTLTGAVGTIAVALWSVWSKKAVK